MSITPEHLLSTVKMLKMAFPTEMTREEFLACASVLYENLSDRNLAKVLGVLTHREEAEVLNDIYLACNMPINKITLEKVQNKLRSGGYDEWLLED